MSPRVTWRLVPDDPSSTMPVIESSMMPRWGDTRPVWIRAVHSRSTEDRNGEVVIEYVLGETVAETEGPGT